MGSRATGVTGGTTASRVAPALGWGSDRRVRRRTSGTRRTAAVTRTTSAAQPHSAEVRPNAVSAGPASAVASGTIAIEPNQS